MIKNIIIQKILKVNLFYYLQEYINLINNLNNYLKNNSQIFQRRNLMKLTNNKVKMKNNNLQKQDLKIKLH